MYQQEHQVPCLHCQPQQYIRMVQHLIEMCLQFQMSRDDCIKALAHHASIHPTVTLTVWKELVKENNGFFQTYFRSLHFSKVNPEETIELPASLKAVLDSWN